MSWAISVAQESSIFPPRRSMAVDFGCGPGRLTGALKGRFDHVVGIDKSPTMLNLARRAHPETNVIFQEDTKTIKTHSVDLIYSAFVLQHLTQGELDECLFEFARILHPGGLLIFQYPARPRWTVPGLAFRLLPPMMLKAIQHYIMRYPGSMPMSWMAPEGLSQRAVADGLAIAEHRIGPRYTPNWEDAWYFARPSEECSADPGDDLVRR